MKGALANAGKNFITNGGLDALGKGAGAASQAAASNRGTKAEIMMDTNALLEQQLLAREAEKRDAQKSAYRAAMMGDYTANWKPLGRPAGVPSMGYPEMTPRSIEAGNMLYNQGRMRLGADDLNSRDSMSGMPAYNDLTKNKEFMNTLSPGFWEKIGGIAGWAAPAVGAMRTPPPPTGTLPGAIPNKGYMG
jgi:hypothetical protein